MRCQLSAAFQKHPTAKLLFLCSPGNPTGTLIPLSTIRTIASDPSYRGIIVVDEAYIDFAPEGSSAAELVQEFANVCVMQTLSKGFGLAGIRCVPPKKFGLERSTPVRGKVA